MLSQVKRVSLVYLRRRIWRYLRRRTWQKVGSESNTQNKTARKEDYVLCVSILLAAIRWRMMEEDQIRSQTFFNQIQSNPIRSNQMQPEPSILNKTVDRLVCRSGGISRVDGLKAGCTVTALAPHLVASNFQGLVPACIHESKRKRRVS